MIYIYIYIYIYSLITFHLNRVISLDVGAIYPTKCKQSKPSLVHSTNSPRTESVVCVRTTRRTLIRRQQNTHKSYSEANILLKRRLVVNLQTEALREGELSIRNRRSHQHIGTVYAESCDLNTTNHLSGTDPDRDRARCSPHVRQTPVGRCPSTAISRGGVDLRSMSAT